MDHPVPPWIESPEGGDRLLVSVELGLTEDDADGTADPQVSTGGWRITSDGEAEWAMAHLAAATAQAQAVKDQYDLWKDRLDAWRDGLVKPAARTIRFFTDRLELYGREQREANPKVATLHFTGGEVGTTLPSGPKIIVVNDAAFCSWALEATVTSDDGSNGPVTLTYAALGCVKTTHEARLKPIREHLHVVAAGDEFRVVTADGENVPGLGVEPAVVTATARPRPLGLTVGAP